MRPFVSADSARPAIGRVPLLPVIDRSSLDIRPIDRIGLPQSVPQPRPNEIETMVALLNSVAPRSMIEFGCRDGCTAGVLLRNVVSLERYTGIDVPMSYQPGLDHQRQETVADPGRYALSDPRFELVIRDRGSLDLGPQDLPACDAAFVDGDHSERVVDHDSELARALVRPGGIIIWHDYASIHFDDVTRVLTRLHHQGWPLIAIEGTWLAFLRV